MAKRAYGQFCGLVRALEIVGERWALVIIRDLLVGPRRFTDLRHGLPRIPTNILSERLKELEEAGVVRRRILPRPAASVVYELTEYGRDLEDVVLRLGRWGARSMTVPRPGEIVTPDAMVLAMRACFQPEAARGLNLRYQLHVGPIALFVRIDEGRLQVALGADADADLVIETGPAIRALMAGELPPEQAIADGHVRLTGDPALLDRFVELFTIPPAPVVH
jgi:DNA-binding HxlR family transcriptional regulator